MRKSFNDVFLDIAELLANSRGTCERLKVGCVLTQHNMPIVMAYNGPISGEPHCSENHCDITKSCKRSQHAERNAINFAAKLGVSTNNAIAYVTHLPCFDCYNALTTAGIKEIYIRNLYKPDHRVIDLSLKHSNPNIYLNNFRLK